jgi:chromate transporter
VSEPAARPRVPLRVLAGVFLRLGATSFGGPAAHVALMEEEVVRRRDWLSHAEFLDLLGATNLIPGPNSTEMAIHTGHRVAGWPGLVVAGACFILPAALIVALLAWAYVTFGALPPVAGVLYGVKPVVIAVVAQALWNLGRSCVRSWPLAALGAAAVALAAAGVHELLVLFGAGLLLAVGKGLTAGRGPTGLAVLAGVPLASATDPVGLGPLFLFFLKVGSVLFGSGYVLLAFLRADLVERYGWLSEQQLLDAVAVGQVTPGPVFTTATFIGYVLAGPAGAAAATVGIFLPAFVFPIFFHRWLVAVAQNPRIRPFLLGVAAAVIGLIAAVTVDILDASIVDVPTAILAVAAFGALNRWHGKLTVVAVVLGCGAAGVILQATGAV